MASIADFLDQQYRQKGSSRRYEPYNVQHRSKSDDDKTGRDWDWVHGNGQVQEGPRQQVDKAAKVHKESRATPKDGRQYQGSEQEGESRVPKEIVGFEHKELIEYKRSWWNYWTKQYEGGGRKAIRKYRRCVKSDLDGKWKVTIEYATKRSMWYVLRTLYRDNGCEIVPGEEVPWREDYRILQHEIEKSGV